MITSNPVGDWNWEVLSKSGKLPSFRAARVAVSVWNILSTHELADSSARLKVSVRSIPGMQETFAHASRVSLHLNPLGPGSALSRVMTEVESLEGDVLVSVLAECPGFWLESGVRHRVEKLFTIQVDIWRQSLLDVTLATYSDAWLTVDTRDREQFEVFQENAPRLAAALGEISVLLGSSPTPGDATRFAVPSETGFEDVRIEGPAYSDSWGTFEVADRWQILHSMIPASADEYEETTDHPVRYHTVQRDGQTLGYVWASVADEAAGYEPRTAAGEDAFKAGAGWLLRLRAAHGQGMTALAALDWVAARPASQEIGLVAEETPRESPSLGFLEELSGRY
ncbi:hypothetical protein [Streptomyces palmae]|uniref:Uncharacterized protein n=1 Tax=Streptomyces palmae TaxID=1701085 RepID=A0A4Z0HE22_9ACTN|nr:hypothetical protein [Streptomyces palmae]TGB11233.1 hypothetical protein E4099_12125 [Streptomyces palmae]